MRWKYVAISLAVPLGACSTTQIAYHAPRVAVIDAPAEGRVYVAIANDTSKPFCLDVANWPDEAGTVDSASDRVALIVDGQRFPMAGLNAGYCPGCGIGLKPGASARAFLNYADFALPTELKNLPKQLIFQPVAASYRGCGRSRK